MRLYLANVTLDLTLLIAVYSSMASCRARFRHLIRRNLEDAFGLNDKTLTLLVNRYKELLLRKRSFTLRIWLAVVLVREPGMLQHLSCCFAIVSTYLRLRDDLLNGSF